VKDISKKIVEAGLVDKHTLVLMQRWGYLDGTVETTKLEQTKETFRDFVDDLEGLLDAKDEEGIKETRFAILLSNPINVSWIRDEENPFIVFHDEADNLIFAPGTTPEVGDCFMVVKTRKLNLIEEVTPLWYGDTLYAYQVRYTPQ
jgi:hypothetical protein